MESVLTRPWIDGFVKHHPALILDKDTILENIRLQACTKTHLFQFYKMVKEFLHEHYSLHPLISNLDEIYIDYNHKFHVKILKKSDASPTFAVHPNREPAYTLDICILGEGFPLLTIPIWPQKTVPRELNELQIQGIRNQSEPSQLQTRLPFEKMMMEYYLAEILLKGEATGLP